MLGELWTARVSRSDGKWHRVELVGAHLTADPIALVREPQHTVAIAALPVLAAALRLARDLLGRCTCMAKTAALEQVDEALATMEGR